MRSLLLSFLLTVIICGYFMSLFEPKVGVFFRKFPEWLFIVMLVIFLAGYLLSLYWGISGMFKGQRIANLLGIGFSLLGILIYVVVYVMQNGNGKESPGQFDHDLAGIESSQQAALARLLQQTNTSRDSVHTVSYWGMHQNPSGFAVCLQKGNIIALQIKNKSLTDLGAISELKKLNWLVLDNCKLTSIETLNLPHLQRLDIPHNQLTSLNGIQHSPELVWLDCGDNPLKDSSALNGLRNMNLKPVIK